MKRSGNPNTHAAISSACTRSTIDPSSCHIAFQDRANSEPNRPKSTHAFGSARIAFDVHTGHACSMLFAVRRWQQVLALVAIGLAIHCGRTVSRRYLFPVRELRTPAVAASDLRLSFPAKDGTLVHALEIVAPEGARTIVDFHG